MAELKETVFQEAAPRVEGGTIYGAKLIGLNSRNNRRYEHKALSNAIGLYEGRKVFIDHPTDTGRDRSFGDWAGVIENVKYRKGDGLYGDVVLRQESDHFKGIVEAASNPKFFKSCGFSHVADGASRFDGDTEIVESIKEVFSVDLVTDPATTSGFFESRQKPKTVKHAVESLPPGTHRTRLIEMMADGYLDGAQPMDSDDKPTDPVSQMSALCKELIAMLGQALNSLASKDPPAPPAPATPPAAPPAPEDEMADDPFKPADKPADKPEDDAFAFESLKRENAELKAKNTLLESGREATAARIKALAAAPEADQAELLESWPVVLTEGERPLRSPALIESNGHDADFPRDNAEQFAALLR